MTTTMLLEGLRAAAVMVRELGGQDMGLACLPRDAVEMLATLPGARMTATAYRGNAEGDYVIESVRVLVDGVTIDAQITPPRMATAEEVAALNGGRAREVGRSVLSVDVGERTNRGRRDRQEG